ncbi:MULTISPECIES: GNAT family N-acetyltransferase [Streptomyces]|uniref:GNAT family N-acetyltransferase n=1 Tax=Streptomyces flaveolus TaxID=67297 RepID=A0ABV3AKN0_9ACTN|nr:MULTISPECIES: GNAT family N-acetyltransferase [Streptomyces]
MTPDALTAPPTGTAGAGGHRIRTRSGRTIVTRQAEAADLAAVNAMHGRCSPQTLYRRYQTGRFALREHEWGRLTRQGMSWVTSPASRPDVVVALTHLVHDGTEGSGELALLVEDGWQDMGLGTALARWALSRAPLSGIRRAVVVTMRDNRRMTAICHSLGAHIEPTGTPGGTRGGTEDYDDIVHFVLAVLDEATPCAAHVAVLRPDPVRRAVTPFGARRKSRTPGEPSRHQGRTRAGLRSAVRVRRTGSG